MTDVQIVVPMAGRGSRFVAAGHQLPKPLIPVRGQPMIELVVDNLRPQRSHRFIFLVLAEHRRAFHLDEVLTRLAPGCVVLEVPSVTAGAACTVLAARDLIDNDNPLVIANSDQYVTDGLEDFYSRLLDGAEPADGVVLTMTDSDPKWSFVRTRDRRVVELVEKDPVSDEATVGIYGFRSGRDFVRAADRMIAADIRSNGEFYVAPVYNELIREGAELQIVNVGRPGQGMWGLGTPADLAVFLAEPVPWPRSPNTPRAEVPR